ncbi:type I polyketide synthase [Methylorubrum salsuginis]|uniref:Phenolphthiocerol/phthiocerol polyketide synthase subunit E n=1 Tax=Methylorubrum salsuginis TaxID=414703 RepID=A0A1I4LQJ0_9HYPH|nr:type I polyketide synthase [Methylorubrum salsuginis]SFL93294.1 Acyl transferase domain-containing protein [Methylorubrum salsuginis]
MADGILDTDIAIVGMALRTPGARNLGEFWHNLREGIAAFRTLSPEDLDAAGESPARYRLPNYVPCTADLPDMEMFDAGFFGLSPKDAAIMDPQHRHFLECAWEAMEHAGLPPERMPGPVGVFAGCGMGSYFYDNVCSHRDLVDQVGLFLLRHTGNDKDFLSTRASFLFDLKGPSVNVQTACSTSLVAVHAACQSLIGRECDAALAGGVTIELPHRRGYLHQEGEILAPDGRCRAFDHRAAGTVFGSGVGVVVLRRLADALADGDPIQAVIKATAVNNDGGGKAGYLAPSVEGQARAIVEAQGLAGIAAETIQYVECHGTGTFLGDPIEIAALTQAFRQSTARKGFCRVGSVKTNIGHLDTAAGVVGLIKTALALHHGEIPASLGYEAPNPAIDFAGSPFRVADRLTPWPESRTPRRAAVNALGVGGTNAHAILEAAPRPRPRRPETRRPHLLLLSGKSRAALDANGAALASAIARDPTLPLSDMAHTLRIGRRAFEHRRVLVAKDCAEAGALLTGADPARIHTHAALAETSGAVFLFPGGGAQHPGMARALYGADTAFRADVDEGLSYLPEATRGELRSVWLDADRQDRQCHERLLRPSLQLPAILIVEVAMARLWMRRGVRPTALIGHSMGENAAACVAGCMALRDAVRLVHLRGELFDSVSGGGMLSVALEAEALAARLPPDLDLASVNAPGLCVVSGPAAAIEAFRGALADEGVDATPIAIAIAAHSRMLEPILARFEAFLRSLPLRAPTIPIVSNLTGDWLTAREACDPLYWVRHLRGTVRFAEGLARLSADRTRVYIEVGPSRALASLAKAQGTISPDRVVNSLPHPDSAEDDHHHVLSALGRAWATGLSVDLDALFEPGARRIELPAYAFQHQRYFLDPVAPAALAPDDQIPAKRPDLSTWGYRPVWRQALAPLRADAEQDPEPRTWLVFLDDLGIGTGLVARLRAGGHTVTVVRAGDDFRRTGPEAFTLCPEQGRPGYDALVGALREDGQLPERILHLWLLTTADDARPGSSPFHRNQERGFHGLLGLAQALGDAAPEALHLTIVTNGMQAIGGRRLGDPSKATVLGPVGVIPKEMPGVTIRAIDLDLAPASSSRPGRLHWALARSAAEPEDALGLLWDDLTAEPTNEIVAYQAGRRFVLGHAPLPLAAAGSHENFREGGTYLMTGGTGDLALALGEALAQRFRARLALVSRSPLPDRALWPAYLRTHGATDRTAAAIAAILRMEAHGAEISLHVADVSNPEEIGLAVAQARSRHGTIHGVIHAAGLVRDGLIALKSPEEAETVLAPKIQGARNLAALFRDAPLDLFVLFSSTSTETAPAGQIDYVAANAYLNAFAEAEAGRDDRRTVAIHWGIWNGVGLAARAVAVPGPTREAAPAVPLFERWTDEGAGGRRLEGRWSARTHWMLDEHRLRSGEAIWPGTGMVEAAVEAVRAHGIEGAFALEELTFLRPLQIADGTVRRVQARLEPARDGYRLDLRSFVEVEGRSGWVRHAQGLVRPLDGPTSAPPDLAAVERACERVSAASAGAALRSVQEAHLAFGRRWRVLRRIALGEGEALADLSLDPAFRGDAETGLLLHPALLDIATGYAMALVPGYDPDEALWVPVAYGVLRIHRPLPDTVRSWVRLNRADVPPDCAAFDVTILDAAGAVLVEIERFTVKRLTDTAIIAGGGLRAAEIEVEPVRSAPPAEGAAARLAAQVRQGILPEEGVEAFFRAIASGRPQVIVSSMDLAALQRLASAPLPVPRTNAIAHADSGAAYEGPRNAVERTLAQMWGELLGVERIGIHDSFFEAGGHSLIAVRLFRMIRKTYAVDLPISALFEAPTIAQCAALVAQAGGVSDGEDRAVPGPRPSAGPKSLHLVPMPAGRGAGGMPLFLCAGMFGNVLNLRHLSGLIGTERPVYGLQARGLYGEHAPHETFEEMAQDYCREIRTVQPRGPYFLGGFSGGGLAAYAMARLLRQEGESVALLVLLDTPLPRRERLSAGDLVAMKLQDLRAQRGAFLANWLVRRAKWEAARLRTCHARHAEVPAERFHDDAIEAAFRRALGRLEMTLYPDPVALFRPRLQVAHRLSGGRRIDANRSLLFEDNGWGTYAQRLSVVEVAGDHDSMVLEPNVRVLARRLMQALREAEPAAQSHLQAAE